jgi:hypothetical protein
VLTLIAAFLAAIGVFFRSRVDTSLEVLALRQQTAVLKRKRPRPSLNRLDRFFWTTLRRIWPHWSDVLVIVKPASVVEGVRKHRDWMASNRLSPLLELAIAAARRSTQGEPGGPNPHSPHAS